MARKRKGANLAALEKAAKTAAHALTEAARHDPVVRKRRTPREVQRELFVERPKERSVLEQRRPRQVRLDDPQRIDTMLALELAAGKPIGRVTRKKLQGRIPDIVYNTLCGRKRKRREVMFARGAAGKGKRRAAQRQRNHQMGLC